METKYLTLSIKSQITLTKEIRNILDLSPGDKVYFEYIDGDVVLKKAEDTKECPICNGDKKVLNHECAICDGEGFIKETLDSKFIINKLVFLLLNHNISIDIKADEHIEHLIKSKTDDTLVMEYIHRCQLFIAKESLSKFKDSKSLIPQEIKEQILNIFDGTDYKDIVTKVINDTQLTIVKDILRERKNITSDEHSKFIDAFDKQYRDSVSKFLLSFVSLD